MSISSYSELKTAVENFALRPSNATVQARVDEWIDLCEAQMMSGMAPPFPFPTDPLRARQMITRDTSFSIDAEYVALPTGFLKVLDLYLDTSPRRPVEYVSPQEFDFLYASTVTESYPHVYTIVGSNLRFAPAPASTVTGIFSYYKTITPLDSDNTSNWILTDAPHVYLHGTLMHAYLMIDQSSDGTSSARAQASAAIFAGGLNALQMKENDSARGAQMVARTLTGTP